jgi:predicted nuclease with TOPRIM domain
MQYQDISAVEKFYKKKFEEFQLEKEALLKRLQDLSELRAESTRLRWNLQQQADEIANLQSALCEAQSHLFTERFSCI